jgi:hypothetical protein
MDSGMKLTPAQRKHESQIEQAYRELVRTDDSRDVSAAVAAWESMKSLILSRDPVVMLQLEIERLSTENK